MDDARIAGELLKAARGLLADQNTDFTRSWLKSVMRDVKKHVSRDTIKRAWAHKTGRTGEFHVPKSEEFPDGFFWYGQVSNLYHAKASGWGAALRELGVRVSEPDEDW